MRYTISTSTKTITVETTKDGEVLRDVNEAIKMLAAPKPTPATWDEVQAEAESIVNPPDLFEDVSYLDVSPEVLASEELASMVPANYLAAE
jgi:hypothetical protein